MTTFRILRLVAILAFSAAFLFLATDRLGAYPVTWFDEGSHLHVAKDLAQFGVYADRSSEGWRYFGPTIGVGPTVLLAIALVFKVAGIGLVQARLVIVGYMLLALLFFGAVATRLYGWGVGLLALFFLTTTPSVDLLTTGREVLGEVPALAFFTLGILLWLRSLEPRRGIGSIALAGVAFALMALTKNQFALVLMPTLVITFAIDRLYYRKATLWHFVIPLAIVVAAVGAGYVALFLLALQSEDPGHLLTLFRNASAGAIWVFAPARTLSSLKLLAGPDFLAEWGLPALVYGIALARERSRQGLEQAFLATFAVIGLGWYAFGSIGWPRYGFAAFAILAIFGAKLARDVVCLLSKVEGPSIRLGRRKVPAAALALTLAIALTGLSPLINVGRSVMVTEDDGPQAMAAYLDARVGPTDVVETWEPELGFLSDRRLHYPPPEWLDRAVRATWLDEPGLVGGYDPIAEARPAYLVVGPFGKYTGIYAQTLAKLNQAPVATLGQYELYRIGRNSE